MSGRQAKPRRSISELGSRLGKAFADFTDHKAGAWAPPVDMQVDQERVSIQVDLPGVDPREARVIIEGDTLTISGERSTQGEAAGTYWHRERRHGSFTRSVNLPPGCPGGQVEAKMHQGVLELLISRVSPAVTQAITITTD